MWPFPSRRSTISPPITPSPMKPRFAMTLGLLIRTVSAGSFRSRVLTHLPQVGAHGFSCAPGIAMLDRFENLLVMILSSLRATLDFEDAHALFTQHGHDRVD